MIPDFVSSYQIDSLRRSAVSGENCDDDDGDDGDDDDDDDHRRRHHRCHLFIDDIIDNNVGNDVYGDKIENVLVSMVIITM